MAIDEIRDTKIKKVEEIRKLGLNPYPAVSGRTHRISEVLERFDELSGAGEMFVLVGRIMARREHGGSIFVDLNDGSEGIQGYVKEDVVGADNFKIFDELIDIGDFVELKGKLFKTQRGERTIEVAEFKLLTKALLPLPEKWHGLQDTEERFRKRYLDFIFNDEIREKILDRFRIIGLMRRFFKDHDFLEVETPILQPIPGGATARPFRTHMNDLDIDLYLRVAPELYLKRYLVAGFERVFEVARNFRNEGMDREHNPEFDMLEAYAAYKDYNWLMSLTEDLIIYLTSELFGSDKILYQGKTVNLKKPFERVEFNEIIRKYAGLDFDTASEDDFRAKAQELNIQIEKEMTKAVIADEIFKKVARPKMIDPIFVINHPIELSPLTKKIPDNPAHVERFQLLMAGSELTNAFSELNDPIDQVERFRAQEKMREQGSEEAQRLDDDFVEALEYGMPPAAGIGIGIDRLIAILTDSHTLREILPFPLMKPK